MTVDTQVAERWVECQAKDRAEVRRIFTACYEADALTAHVFWYEPWYPEGAVVRVCLPDDAEFDIPCIPWNPNPDAELYEKGWETVQKFFERSSVISTMGYEPDAWFHGKMVHCYLNAQALDVHQELSFALGFAWGRLRMCWTDRRRLAKRLFRA